MRILVTGATGFVGAHLVEFLKEQGHDVTSVFRSASARSNDTKCIYIGSIDSATKWDEKLVGFDVVIHCAARAHIMDDIATDPLEAYREVNTRGTINLAKACDKAGVSTFIYVSSVKVNGESTTGRSHFSPEDKPEPLDFYGVSKAEAERELQTLKISSKMAVTIIRPPLIYGPGVKANFASLIRLAKSFLPMPFGLLNKNRRSMVSIYNLADFVNVCLSHDSSKNETFLISDGDDMSTLRLFKILKTAHGRRSLLIPIPPSVFFLVGFIFRRKGLADRLCGSLQVDISKSYRLLGWQPPYSPEEGLARTVKEAQKLSKTVNK